MKKEGKKAEKKVEKESKKSGETAKKEMKEEVKAVVEEIAKEQLIEDDEEELPEEKLPFPKATIVNMLRKSLTPGKQIKGTVKNQMNLWLGKMVERIAKKLDSHPYSYVDGSMLRDAIETYENVQDIEKEKERIIKQLESIKAACDVLILEVDRKFVK